MPTESGSSVKSTTYTNIVKIFVSHVHEKRLPVQEDFKSLLERNNKVVNDTLYRVYFSGKSPNSSSTKKANSGLGPDLKDPPDEWQKVVNELRSADIFIAILSDDYISRKWCMEECARADELGLYRVGVQYSGKQLYSDIPSCNFDKTFVLPDVAAEKKSAVTRLIDYIDAFVANKVNAHAMATRIAIRRALSIHRDVFSLKYLTAQAQCARQMLLALAREIENESRQIATLNYDYPLGRDRDFLIRAEAMFSTASKVVAVSRDSVSGFWISPDEGQTKKAARYAMRQIPSCIRVFSFSNPRNLNNYRSMLDLNAEKYGRDGAVFVCSENTLRSLLDNCYSTDSNEQGLGKELNIDFGVLQYSNPEDPSNLIWLHAELESEQLRFDRSSGNVRGDERFVDALTKAKYRTDPYFGKMAASLNESGFWTELRKNDAGASSRTDAVTLKPEFDPTLRLLRWDPTLHSGTEGTSRELSQENWATTLAKIFATNEDVGEPLSLDRSYGPVKHIVVFRLADSVDRRLAEVGDEAFVRCLHGVCQKITDALNKPGLSYPTVWVGKRLSSLRVEDHDTKGRLITGGQSDSWSYMLEVEFASEKDLVAWYKAEKHSKIRKEVYKNVNPSVSEDYIYIDELLENKTMSGELKDQIIEFLFNKIEDRMRSCIWRLDYQEISDFTSIAKELPVRSFDDLRTAAENEMKSIDSDEVTPWYHSLDLDARRLDNK